jgi:hypothetical protein
MVVREPTLKLPMTPAAELIVDACLFRLAAVPRQVVVPWEWSVAPFETLDGGQGALTHEGK